MPSILIICAIIFKFMTTRKQVFIEKIMPVKLLNEQVYYEHGGNPFKGLHRWYSRKPLSFSRASVLASLLTADVTMEEFEYLLGLNHRVGGMQDKTTKLYKTPPGEVRIKKVQDLCEKMWGTRTPTVLDAFAGGGSIPFEAARYGLNVLASDLNPVAVVTMKAAMEYPLKFGADLQQDIDKWVKWVGDEAEKRLAEFFPSLEGEKIQNYLWAHTVVCPSCESVVPLSPNWWLYKRPEKQNLSKWCAVKPIPNLKEKRVDFELVRGKKGKGTTIITVSGEEYDPDTTTTIARGAGKCPNCGNVIENEYICSPSQSSKLSHQLYAVAFKKGKGNLDFTTPREIDFKGVELAEKKLETNSSQWESLGLISHEPTPTNPQYSMIRNYGVVEWHQCFNPRQELTLMTYVEIINEAKELMQAEYEPEMVEAILVYLSFVFDRCMDHNSRLSGWHSSRASVDRASKNHALNLNWNYPEVSGIGELWYWGADAFASDYQTLCKLIGAKENNLLASNKIEKSKRDAYANEIESLEIKSSAQASSLQTPKNPSLRISKRKYLPHWQLDGATYFLTFVTHDRLELNEAAKQTVLDACQFFNGKRYTTFALVIMPDHVHWLLKPLPTNDRAYWTLTSITHSIKSFTAKEIPKVMKHIGKLWQIESYDRIIRDEREFLDTWEYIRQNPIKDGLSELPEDYPFFWEAQDEDFQENSKRDACADGDLENLKNPSKISDADEISSAQASSLQIVPASADNLSHILDKSVDAIVTDPPYYGTIPYADISDFFYVWMKRNLGDIFPDLFWMELTDKEREAVANPSRFRNMGTSPEELANQDYEAKMAMAFAEYHRVLRDDGVMTVQFNHKESGAWDVLAKSLIDAGFEITASWAVSTENPQNLHQAQKNSVASTVLLVCRKRDPNAGQAWWDDLRPEVANLVEQRAPEFESNDITGIDLYLSAFGPALNVFSRNYPILDSAGTEVRPEVAFAEARKAVANYRFRKLAQTDTAGFDPLTQWYFLAWDAFRAREFPFDDARQLALAVGGFNVADLGKTYKLLDVKSGTCKFLSPDQRFKKRAFSLSDSEFSARYLVDGLHAIIALYLEEQTIEPVRRFMKATGLIGNEMFMRSWEVALKVIPHIGDPRKRIPEEKALADLWLAMDEIKAKVTYVQPELDFTSGQMGLDFDPTEEEE
jgi:adenine-specific DNA methylase